MPTELLLHTGMSKAICNSWAWGFSPEIRTTVRKRESRNLALKSKHFHHMNWEKAKPKIQTQTNWNDARPSHGQSSVVLGI